MSENKPTTNETLTEPLPIINGERVTREQVMEALRLGYEAMITLAKQEDPSTVGFPDVETVLDHIDEHGLPANKMKEGACSESPWKRIESAPRDAVILLSGIKDDFAPTSYYTTIGFWSGGDDGHWMCRCGEWLFNPTYWMPLPNPPTDWTKGTTNE